jgi:hypothetical protein
MSNIPRHSTITLVLEPPFRNFLRHFLPAPTREGVRIFFNPEGGVPRGEGVSNYQIGAFEALRWVWYMLRDFRDQPSGVDEARRTIQEVLADMGRGTEVNFREEMSSAALPP